MKPSIACLALCLALACGSSQPPDISGTYVNVSTNNIRTLYDTLEIKLIGKDTRTVYDITKRARIVFKEAEAQQFNKVSRESETADFDADNNLLRSEDPGVIYVWDRKERTLRLDSFIYRKI